MRGESNTIPIDRLKQASINKLALLIYITIKSQPTIHFAGIHT